jgi:hypothetical protein
MYLDNQERKSEDVGVALADTIGGSLQRTLDMVAEIARREGVDLTALADEPDAPAPPAVRDPHREDPLVVRASEYGHLAWRVSRAITPIVATRGEARVIDAVATIEWFSSLVSSKIYRAVSGQTEGWEPREQVQTDFNGSAKIALLGVAESRDAWGVLMEPGTATADGVPAQAVTALDALDAAIRARFPHAMAFVRPGFDAPAIAVRSEGRS